MRKAITTLAILNLLAWAAACGGGSSDTRKDGAAGTDALAGTGGHTATGGSSGSTGGSLGSGGRGSGGITGAGGVTAIDGGAGGVTGSGGRATGGGPGSGGSGGRATGGGPGSGGSGSGGNVGYDGSPAEVAAEVGRDSADAKPDVAPDGKLDLTAPDLPMGSETPLDVPSGSLEACFAGLPAPVGMQMVATKSTSDARVRIRIALDTENRMGTSGTYGWGLIRLGVEVNGVVTCITDRANLKYSGSHHNCDDTATATAGATTYSIVAPDRPSATLTIQGNGTTTGPFTLDDQTCAMTMSAGPVTCRSGGPCD